jgi:hypothetical protein
MPGCLTFLFGPCTRKRSKERKAVSVEQGVNTRNKETATQTQDQVFRSSAPASLFPSAHKPVIAVRDSNGFRVQGAKRDLAGRLEALDSERLGSLASERLGSVQNEEIESIHSEKNDDALMSSKSIQRLFSPSSSNSSKVVPNLFVWDSHQARPKLLPITPEQFIRKKIIPAQRPIRPLERIAMEMQAKEE